MKHAVRYTKIATLNLSPGPVVELVEKVEGSELKREGQEELHEWLCRCPPSLSACLVWVADQDVITDP